MVPPEEQLEQRVGENVHNLAATRACVGPEIHAGRNGFGSHPHRKARALVGGDRRMRAFSMGTKPPIKRDL